ncbi:MAG TPA: hypothetical protein VF502_03885 [Stellaceae bacterium]
MRSARIFGAAAMVAALVAAVPVASTAANKEAPACAALTFRPIPSGSADGEQDAGLYKSRFGRIALKATVKNGEPHNYFVEVNGKPPAPIAGAVPSSVEACAKAKRLGAIGNPPESCIGDRFAVLVDHSGEQRHVLLYAHHRGEWRFCSAGNT